MEKTPTISLVVTVKNDPIGLMALMGQIAHQTRLPQEIIITIAGTATTTLAQLAPWQAQHPQIPVRAETVDTATRSTGRNRGVALATGDIVVFTDAGCRPDKDWLQNLIQPFIEHPATQLVSGYTAGDPHNVWETAQVPFVLVHLAEIPQHPLPATRNMAIRRSLFLEMGGFSPRLNYAEDFAFSRQLEAHQILSTFVPQAIVYWRPRPNLMAFFTMIRRLTAGDIQAGIVRPGLISLWVRYAVFGMITLMVWWAWHQVSYALFILGIVLAVYLLAKLFRLKIYTWPLSGATMIIQLVCDVAVLVGSLWGLVAKITPPENAA
jgi:cellulose synthase/poly-beta-1,6-N-acetylglucosamine synthase-like glycosyltransferase